MERLAPTYLPITECGLIDPHGLGRFLDREPLKPPGAFQTLGEALPDWQGVVTHECNNGPVQPRIRECAVVFPEVVGFLDNPDLSRGLPLEKAPLTPALEEVLA